VDHAPSLPGLYPASRFSVRTARERSAHRLAQALARSRARGERLLDLTLANPTLAGLELDENPVLAPLGDPRGLRYEPEPLGLPAARAAIARELTADGMPVDAERVVLTASTSEAYAFLFKLLCDPGDEVLVPAPGYPLLEQLAALEGVSALPYRLAYAAGWYVDLDSLRAAITPRTRAILAVHPNHPTGNFLRRHELAELVATGLPLVCDEVFARYPLRAVPDRAHSALEAEGASLVFSLGGLSKLAALPQMKLAWIALGGEARAVAEALARLEWIADAFLSVATPVQHALPHWLAAAPQRRERISARTRLNLAALERGVAGTAASLLDVEGGWHAILRLPATRSEEDWSVSLLERDAVLAHPGWLYDLAGGPHLVLSLLPPEKDFEEGVARICARARAA